MYAIVIGASPIGQNVIELALQEGHRVSLIEADPERARTAINQYDISVFQANITDDDVLDEAEASHADALIAATDDDATRLMAVMLGREYGIEHLVSLVDNSKHKKFFDRLGASTIDAPERLIANYLYNRISDAHSQDGQSSATSSKS